MNRHARVLVLLAGVALAGWACGPNANPSRPDGVEESAYAPEEAEGPPLFEDVTARSGVRMTYRNGEEADHLSIFESVGGGVGVLDYDGDGLPDLFVPGGGGFAGPQRLPPARAEDATQSERQRGCVMSCSSLRQTSGR